MKKYIGVLSIIVLLIMMIFVGCNNKITTEDGLIEKARDEIDLAESETIELQVAGFSDEDKSRFVWFIAGNEEQGYTYIPMEFEKKNNDELLFIGTCLPIERYEDISLLKISSGYSFMVNDEKCKYIYIVINNEQENIIKVKNIPFVYYYEYKPQNNNSSFEYYFLDESKNVLK